MKIKDCLVSFSSKGREDYNVKLLPLLDSALEHWKGDFLIYSPDHWLDEYKGIKIHKGYPPLSATHEEQPYAFKLYAIMEALRLDYERIVWLDTSMALAKDITPLFGITGVGVFHNLGHPLYKYISDEAMSILNVSENEVFNISQIWGGALFFDFSKQNANAVFLEICQAAEKGAFNEGGSIRDGFVAHRHDQAVMSVLVHGRCDMYPYGRIVSKEHAKTKEYGDDYFLIYG